MEQGKNISRGVELRFYEVEMRLLAVDLRGKGRAWVWSGNRWRFVPAIVGKAFADGYPLDRNAAEEMFPSADFSALERATSL